MSPLRHQERRRRRHPSFLDLFSSSSSYVPVERNHLDLSGNFGPGNTLDETTNKARDLVGDITKGVKDALGGLSSLIGSPPTHPPSNPSPSSTPSPTPTTTP